MAPISLLQLAMIFSAVADAVGTLGSCAFAAQLGSCAFAAQEAVFTGAATG